MSTDAAFDDADLNGFVDGRIDPSRGVALAASLASDPESRARIDGWKRQNESLRTMFASVLFEPVPVRLLPTAVPAAPPPLPAVAPREPSAGPRRFASVVATTSVGMALVGFALGALTSLNTDGFGLAPSPARGVESNLDAMGAPAGSGLTQRAAETHRTFMADGIRPVEITAAEEPKLLRWLQHRIDASLRIPDLQRQGWGLVGGRIVPGAHGPAAFLVYNDGTDRLGLYLSRAPASGEFGVGTVGGAVPVGVETWDDGQFGYALTSDRGALWLERNAEPLRTEVSAQMRGNTGSP